MYNEHGRSDRIGVVKIVSIYAVFSALWIWLSDSFFEAIAKDVSTLALFSEIKGLAFIVLTALLLYRLILRYVEALRIADARNHALNETLEKRNAELQSERARWWAAVNGIADEVWLADTTGNISLVNLPTITHMGLVEFKDQSVEQVLETVEILNMDEEPRPPEDAPLLRSLNGETVRGEEIMRHRETGIRRYRQYSSAPMHDSDGSIIGAVAIVRDITDHKEAERAACAAEIAKSQFLANMSHELRTPMAGVLGMLEIALGGPLEDEPREYIETAHNSAGSLVRILNDILETTKLQTGIFSIEKIAFCPRDCVSRVVEIFGAEMRRKGLCLNVAVDDDIPATVIGDRVRIGQVLTNLVGNAVKFTERGRVDIKVEAEGSATPAPSRIRFAVSDTGIGIPKEKKPVIFTPFSQVDASHTRRYGGAGLGLSISKEIVERMGGSITFDSVEGAGCTFSFSVPVEEGDKAPHGHSGAHSGVA